MRKRDTALLAIGFLALVAPLPAFAGQAPPLIPLDELFGNPVKASPQLSPDGTRISYLAPSDKGVVNVWVKTLGKDDDVQITNETSRSIYTENLWAYDGKHYLHIQDVGGNEDFHVYSTDLETRIVRDLTPFQGIGVMDMEIDEGHPNEMLVGLNLRDPEAFDMYRVDLTTGAIVLDTRNPGDVFDWITDDAFRIRGALAMSAEDGSRILRVRDGADAPWRDIAVWPFGERGRAIGFTKDGKALWVKTSLGSDTTRLVKMDAATGKELQVVASSPKVDAGEVIVRPRTREVQAVSFNYLRNEWTVLDPSIRADFEALAKVRRGEFYIQSRDLADRSWIVMYRADDGPYAWYVWRREAKRADFLFVDQPALEKHTLARTEPKVIRSRDGLDLVSYLTLPPGAEPKGLPLLLDVHGGPDIRDDWRGDPEVQWLANRGYAVLQVNFRGSSGFGKRFENAGNGQWGAAMQDDLTDAVKWAIAEGIADPKKVCIYGGSYGGYAVLAGLAFTPDLYACGVDIVGPSNLKTLLESMPKEWGTTRKEMALMIGDVERDEALNRRISPAFHADKVKVPLIIAQGANDPRVPIRESDQMVEAMRARGLPVTYVVYPDEGHGFARMENRLDFWGRVDEFLAKHLGGRSQPYTKIEGTTAEQR